MFIKKFEANSLEEALQLVKSELGSDALVLSTEKKNGGMLTKPRVQVTAACEKKNVESKAPKRAYDKAYDKAPKSANDKANENKSQQAIAYDLASIFPHRLEAQPTEPPTNAKQESLRRQESRYIDITGPALKLTCSSRKNLLEPSRFAKGFIAMGLRPESASALSERLVVDYSLRELNQPRFLHRAQVKLLSGAVGTLNIESIERRKQWVFLGPNGCGKTTLAVKLCLRLMDRKKKVQLISCDKRKILGRSELSAYARCLGIDFFLEAPVVRDVQTIQIMDTAAINPYHPEWDIEMEKCVRNRGVILVLDATSRYGELMRIIDYAEQYSPAALAFTKLDIAWEKGIIYDVLKSSRLPLLCVSNSMQFKDGVKFFEPTVLGEFMVGDIA